MKKMEVTTVFLKIKIFTNPIFFKKVKKDHENVVIIKI